MHLISIRDEFGAIEREKSGSVRSYCGPYGDSMIVVLRSCRHFSRILERKDIHALETNKTNVIVASVSIEIYAETVKKTNTCALLLCSPNNYHVISPQAWSYAVSLVRNLRESFHYEVRNVSNVAVRRLVRLFGWNGRERAIAVELLTWERNTKWRSTKVTDAPFSAFAPGNALGWSNKIS